MIHSFAAPYIANGSGEIVFFLIVLIWIIGGLLKKAGEASKRSSPQGPARAPRPPQRPRPWAPGPSLSDFLKRIQQTAEHPEEPAPHPQAKPELSIPGPVLRMPSPSLRPPESRRPEAGSSVLPTPSLRRPKKEVRVVPPAEVDAAQEFEPIERPVATILRKESLTASPPEPQEPAAYAIRKTHEPPTTAILGVAISTGEMKKGIILAEILGPPKAIRHRRHLAGGR